MSPSSHSAHDTAPPPGVTLDDAGATFCVYAGHAETVEVCLFEAGDDEGATERRVGLAGHARGWWFGHVEGIGPGQRYAVRVHGPWAPDEGLRHDPGKLLLDPYARAVEGGVDYTPAVFGHETGDSAPAVPRCVVVDDTFDWGDDRSPTTPWTETVVYETHVKGFSALHAEVPDHLRGTYAGLAHPASIAHLTSLGITTVELLPVHAFTHEPHLVEMGKTNYWGYNTMGYFAPHAPYAAASDPQGVLDEFKGMVKLLHAEGLEVVLDVVYNHTAEQSVEGATLSWRGLDAPAYYRLDEHGRDIDVTGCGNTMDLTDPVTCRMVLDSLRYWVTECHVDGFRFDLAVALARGRDNEFDPEHPFLMAMRTDPVLSSVKLIAEPWDVGRHGWRTGQFPPPFSEWNDRFRDTARGFWLPGLATARDGRPGHGINELATRIAGSEDLFGERDRGTVASVNLVAAHDGFTLADLTAYDSKHNEANGEGNRDGSNHNRSWNHGVEGPTDDEGVLAARRRSMRNLMALLLLSTGVPMVNGGDEFGRSQLGNNNPYSQDNELTWFHWDLKSWQEDLLATTSRLTEIRRDHPVLRQRHFFTGREVHEDGSTDLAWYAANGRLMGTRDWEDPHARTLQAYFDGAWLGHRSVLLVVHGDPHDGEVTLPSPPGLTAYRLVWDSAWERPEEPGDSVSPGPVAMTGASMRVYAAADPS